MVRNTAPPSGAMCFKSPSGTGDKKHPKENLILTQHFQMGLDGHKHKRNTNVLVIGGSGAGKSRSYAIPNALNCGTCSMVICP